MDLQHAACNVPRSALPCRPEHPAAPPRTAPDLDRPESDVRPQPPAPIAAAAPPVEDWATLRASIERSVDRLLIAAGVSPDHPATRSIGRRLDAIGAKLAKA